MPARSRSEERKKLIPAKRVFTDREEPQQAFRNAYEKISRTPADYQVLHFYGRGGIGKSSLLRELYRQMEEQKRCSVFYDMEEGTEMRKILTRLRNILKRKYPKDFSFDVFDIALLKFSELAGERNELVDREDELIIESNPILSLVMDGVAMIPGLSIVSTIAEKLTKGYHYFKDITDMYAQYLAKKAANIKDLQMNELLQKLPEFFSEDLAKSTEQMDQPVVFFLDTYERLVSYMADTGVSGNEDRWLRDEIIQYVPNAVWVIAGRDRLRWKEIDARWKDDPDYSDHILGQLSLGDSVHYLQMAGIEDGELCAELFRLTDGDPLFLDLCVSTWQELAMAGKVPKLEDFGGREDLVSRYLRDMDAAHKDMAEMLACIGKWTSGEVRDRIIAICGTFSDNIYETIRDSTLVQSDGADGYYLHRVVKEAILSRISKARMQEITDRLAAFDKKKETLFSLNYVSVLDTDIDQLVESLKKQLNVSTGSIEKKINTLEKQGNYREIFRALLPLFQYEESVAFRDLSVYELLDRYLRSEVEADELQRQLSDTEKLYEAYQKPEISDRIRSRICESMIYSLMNNGKQQEALELALKRKKEAEDQGKLDYYYSNLLGVIGGIYVRQKRYHEAVPILEDVRRLQDEEVRAGKREKRGTGNALKNLAFSYRFLKQPQKVLELEQERLAILSEDFGESHPQVLSCRGSIASALSDLGRKDEAEAELREIVAQFTAQYGRSYLYTLIYMVHLAIVCYQQGKYTDAWNLYREVYELKREKLGDEDPETWRSLHEFADAYGWIGDDVKKKELNEQALAGLHRTKEPNEAHFLGILYSLLACYNQEGEYGKGEAVCREAVELLQRNPGLQTSYPTYFGYFAEWLGHYCRKQGKYREAAEADRLGHEYLQKTFGEDHKRTQTLKRNLAYDLKKEEEIG